MIFSVIIFGVGFGIYKSALVFNVFGSIVSANVYSAVFIDNSQVYFGKVENIRGSFMTLTDVYYFGRDSNSQNINDPDIVLVKLGNELHGPEDEMKINTEHILYVEELNENSRVVEAINSYENNE